jgi:hypothetical protein
MVQDISPFYKESIHAGDGWELAAQSMALCPLISFPDNFYQFNCRQTPLQTFRQPPPRNNRNIIRTLTNFK